jgi:hypothetical protein
MSNLQRYLLELEQGASLPAIAGQCGVAEVHEIHAQVQAIDAQLQGAIDSPTRARLAGTFELLGRLLAAVPETVRSDLLTNWRLWYFHGVSQQAPATLDFGQAQLQSLFSMVGVRCTITTGAVLDPRLIMNAKGTTAWVLLYSLLFFNDKAALAAVAADAAFVAIPAAKVHAAFQSHVNWPVALLERFPLHLQQGTRFVLPFLMHRSQGSPTAMRQSLKTPDGQLEIFGCSEFDDTNPVLLLQTLASV